MLSCRIFGHRYRFGNEGATMRWACERGCGAGGEKTYPAAAEARRYARAFDYDERDRPASARPALRPAAAAALAIDGRPDEGQRGGALTVVSTYASFWTYKSTRLPCQRGDTFCFHARSEGS